MRIALTFDDGPGPLTAAIATLLARHGGRATFFVLGQHVRGAEATLRRMLAAGHELGNHTYSHRHPVELTDDELRDELERTSVLLRAVGVEPRLARPPYGEDAERFARVAAELGLESVLWTVDPEDWREPPAEVLVDVVLREARDGAVVDLHDGRRSPRATLQALERIVPELVARRFRLVTASELLGSSR